MDAIVPGAVSVPRRLHAGWLKDKPDARDFEFELPKTWQASKLPSSVDEREFCLKLEDQGTLGSCTANALTSAMEFLEAHEMARRGVSQCTQLSRLQLYFAERRMEGTIDEDAGAMIRSGVKCLLKYGVCEERLWPYADNAETFKKAPPPECWEDALKRQLVKGYRLTKAFAYNLRYCLAHGWPVALGFQVSDTFAEQTGNTGIMAIPDRNTNFVGGHAICAVGYDDKKDLGHGRVGAALIENSWGDGWGEKGYFWMPYSVIDSGTICDDFWAVSKRELPA